jgi:molybdenum cofactor synthesis domain-containing protein
MVQFAHMPTAAIIVIGDEILSGKFADENAVLLVKELRELGVALRRIEVIPDVLDEIAAAVASASQKHDLVFTSGGVGPTHDDVTIAGVARAFGVRVVRQAQLESILRSHFGAAASEHNLRMADLPEGADLVWNDGTGNPANQLTWPVPRARNVYILPGVPAIFRRKFAAIKERFRATPFHVRRVYCLGDEGDLAKHMDAVVAAHPAVAVGSYPRIEAQDYRVIITLESKEAAATEAALADLVARLPAGIVVRTE